MKEEEKGERSLMVMVSWFLSESGFCRSWLLIGFMTCLMSLLHMAANIVQVRRPSTKENILVEANEEGRQQHLPSGQIS